MESQDDPKLEINRPSAQPDPSEQEIRDRCWAIQANWSKAEERRRAGCFVNPRCKFERLPDELVG